MRLGLEEALRGRDERAPVHLVQLLRPTLRLSAVFLQDLELEAGVLVVGQDQEEEAWAQRFEGGVEEVAEGEVGEEDTLGMQVVRQRMVLLVA